jgi:hypothetical protein
MARAGRGPGGGGGRDDGTFTYLGQTFERFDGAWRAVTHVTDAEGRTWQVGQGQSPRFDSAAACRRWAEFMASLGAD